MEQRFEHRKYKKIENHIRELVEKGKLIPGEPAPVLNEMCREFDCTRQTASKAYRILAREEILKRVPGLGWYIT